MNPDSGSYPGQQSRAIQVTRKEKSFWKQHNCTLIILFCFQDSCEFAAGESGPRRLNTVAREMGVKPSFPSCTLQDCGNDTMQVMLPYMFSSENPEYSLGDKDILSGTLIP